MTFNTSHHNHLTITVLYYYVTISCAGPVSTFLCTHLNYSPSSCDWGLQWSWQMQGAWLSRRDVCTHWLQLLSSSFPPLTWLRLRWQQRESRHKTVSYSHSTIITPCTTPLQSHAGITPGREQSVRKQEPLFASNLLIGISAKTRRSTYRLRLYDSDFNARIALWVFSESLMSALIALWPRKMKIDCSRQTCLFESFSKGSLH